MTRDDILAVVPGETNDEKLTFLCEFYDAIEDLLIARDIWKYIGDDPTDAANFLSYHGLAADPRQ